MKRLSKALFIIILLLSIILVPDHTDAWWFSKNAKIIDGQKIDRNFVSDTFNKFYGPYEIPIPGFGLLSNPGCGLTGDTLEEYENEKEPPMPELDIAFDEDYDLIALHYDVAPDYDDIHSAAADRTILEDLYGLDWLCKNTTRVTGAYGTNPWMYARGYATAIMESVWSDCGGKYFDAHEKRQKTIRRSAKKWINTIDHGGNVWVKEGGQSDITGNVIKRIIDKRPDIDIEAKVFVVQHAPEFNETFIKPDLLDFVKDETTYLNIPGGNERLCAYDHGANKGRGKRFAETALDHPDYGHFWETALYLFEVDGSFSRPWGRLDFSDTTALYYIINYRDRSYSIEDTQELFLD